MISLDPTLQSAQDSDNHQPIISLVSTSFADSIPFDGFAFDSAETEDGHPDLILLSTGALACVASRGNNLVLLVTDTDRIEWSVYTIFEGSVVCKPAIIELSGGELGIVYVTTGYDLYCMVVGTDGTVTTTATLINNYSTWISTPSLGFFSDGGTFVVAYAYLNGSNEYSISIRTSSDFETWSSVTTIAPSGLDNTARIDNPDILMLSDSQLFLVFDYVDDISNDLEIINCYYMVSDDDGATWSSPVGITGYETFITVGSDPVLAERANGDIEICFVESTPVLTMDSSNDGWESSRSHTPSFYYDPSTDQLYTKQKYDLVGGKIFLGFLGIDVESWDIVYAYDYDTTPQIDDVFNGDTSNIERDFGDGIYDCSSVNVGGGVVAVLNRQSGTITNYVFNEDIPAYSLTANVQTPFYDEYGNTFFGIVQTEIHADTNRLYVFWNYGWYSVNRFRVGYIDLTESPDPSTGMYSWHQEFSYSAGTIIGYVGMSQCILDIDNDLLIVSCSQDPFVHGSLVYVFQYSSGGLIATYYNDYYSGGDAGFHLSGCNYRPVLINNHLYADVLYTSTLGQEDRRGLMDIDLSTGNITYHRPSWGTYDNYSLHALHDMGDGRILIGTLGYGITIYDIASDTWVLYDTSTLPGLPSNSWYDVDYDPVNDIIFAGGVAGVVAFPESGEFNQLKYITGEYDGTWSFGDAAQLTNTQQEIYPAVVIDADNALWAVWDHTSLDEDVLYWAVELAEKDLSSYVTNDPVIVSWEIDSVATLDFSLSHGHLFDPSNSMSTLAQFLKKGRKVEFQIGEKVSDVDCLQAQGTFVIRGVSVSYQRGKYPVIKVSCEDLSTVWSEQNITATEYFSNIDPQVILETLVEDFGGVASTDIDMPSLDNSHNLYHQFIDQDLREIIDSILGHFGYFLYFDVDGKASAKKIDLLKDVEHAYTNQIIDFTPDDSFSNFTNKVVVIGEGREFLEVLYEPEAIETVSGTILPFGGEKTVRVWFSKDHSRTCRNAYLSVDVSIREYENFLMAIEQFLGAVGPLSSEEGGEGISEVDPEEHYIDITIYAPDLTGLFITVIANILAAGTATLTCVYYCGIYTFALSMWTQMMGLILGASAQYSYEIYAQPIGHEKQTFQADSEDIVFQRQLGGLVVTEEIEDPFCYTVAHCQRVADFELSVVRAQRSRVSFSKPSHLQDEIGDMIQVNHPYTDQDVKIFVAGLIRTYQKGAGVQDKLEGWVV